MASPTSMLDALVSTAAVAIQLTGTPTRESARSTTGARVVEQRSLALDNLLPGGGFLRGYPALARWLSIGESKHTRECYNRTSIHTLS